MGKRALAQPPLTAQIPVPYKERQGRFEAESTALHSQHPALGGGYVQVDALAAGFLTALDPSNPVFLKGKTFGHQLVLFCLMPSNKVAGVLQAMRAWVWDVRFYGLFPAATMSPHCSEPLHPHSASSFYLQNWHEPTPPITVCIKT